MLIGCGDISIRGGLRQRRNQGSLAPTSRRGEIVPLAYEVSKSAVPPLQSAATSAAGRRPLRIDLPIVQFRALHRAAGPPDCRLVVQLLRDFSHGGGNNQRVDERGFRTHQQPRRRLWQHWRDGSKARPLNICPIPRSARQDCGEFWLYRGGWCAHRVVPVA
jgi:hypothetical protein